MKLGFFSDVVVEERGDPERPELVFRVVEKPTVRETSIVGNKELSVDDLKAAMEVKRGATLDRAAVKRTVRKIQETYVEKGYYLAEVTSRIDEGADQQVTVVFEVNERAKVQVREIRFVGNRHVSREELLSVMSDPGGEPALLPDHRRELPRGGLRARPQAHQLRLRRQGLRLRQGGEALRQPEPRPALALRDPPHRRGRAVHGGPDRLRRGPPPREGRAAPPDEGADGRDLRPLQGGQGPPRGRPTSTGTRATPTPT